MQTVFGAAIVTAVVFIQPARAIMPAPSEASRDLKVYKMILDVAKSVPADKAAALRHEAAKLLQLLVEEHPTTPEAKEAAKLLRAFGKIDCLA
jgi:hypothetical protein